MLVEELEAAATLGDGGFVLIGNPLRHAGLIASRGELAERIPRVDDRDLVRRSEPGELHGRKR